MVFLREIKNFRVKWLFFLRLTDLAISDSMSSFVGTDWLNWQILVAIFNEFRSQKENTKVYIPVHPWRL